VLFGLFAFFVPGLQARVLRRLVVPSCRRAAQSAKSEAFVDKRLPVDPL
jgi:hypothetical protein